MLGLGDSASHRVQISHVTEGRESRELERHGQGHTAAVESGQTQMVSYSSLILLAISNLTRPHLLRPMASSKACVQPRLPIV